MMAGGYFPISIAGSKSSGIMSCLQDPVSSRELRLLQQQLAMAQREGPDQWADRLPKIRRPDNHRSSYSRNLRDGGTSWGNGRPFRERRLAAGLSGLRCCVVGHFGSGGFGRRTICTARVYAQSKPENPLQSARTAVETLINRLRGSRLAGGDRINERANGSHARSTSLRNTPAGWRR